MNLRMLISYVALFGLWTLTLFVLVPVPLNLIVTSSLVLYIGCHRSLRLRDETSLEASEAELISKEGAMKAPIFGSAVLFGIYLSFKFLDERLVNMLLAAYFAFIGALAMGATVNPLIIQLCRIKDAKRHGRVLTLPLMGELDLTFTNSEMVSLAMGAAFAAAYTRTKHWALNNIFGMTFCVQAMERVSLGSVKVAGILLAGLFLYDVFWVYGGPVMESVAKSVQGPIKILFVSVWADDNADPPIPLKTSMLGLGDIVIPGLYAALLLRFDAGRANADPTLGEHGHFPKPYFHACLVAYILGLGATVVVMYYFKAAQPALFYLVPTCLGSSAITAFYRKETSALLEYDEDGGRDNEAGANPSAVASKKDE